MSQIRTITIARIGSHRTVQFAAEELRKYLKRMDSKTIVDMRLFEEYDPKYSNYLWIGQSDQFQPKLPAVEDCSIDDAIVIDIRNFKGIITGSNQRSVLIAVYRFLRELGVAWVHPGEEGENIPKRVLDDCHVDICEKPSSRHRVICIEGAVAYEHIRNMIDWLPKMGFNGYEMQFMTPMIFLNRWHTHSYNAKLGEEPITREEAYAVLKMAEEEIAKRSLIYHAVGHGWTSEPFGIPSNGWDRVDPETVPAETKELFALVCGKRTLFKNIPASTQLCYSNPKAISAVSNSVADYCDSHPEVDYIIVALADSSNNFCECAECAKLRPADWYIDLLNSIDQCLTERKLKTKVVMCAYNELAWAPKQNKIKNPDRFTVIYCPITRPYTESYDEYDLSDLGDEPPYVLNKLDRPREMKPLLRLYDGWKKSHPDLEYCLFDYHLWFSNTICDPGRFAIAKMILRDIETFPKLGIKGLISCQIQREGFPTNLPMVAMAESLWNNQIDFETVCNAQLEREFGPQYSAAKAYLSEVSDLLAYWPHRLSEADVIIDEEKRKNAEKAVAHVAKYKAMIQEIAEGEFEFDLQKRFWQNLLLHTEIADICARIAIEKFSGKTPDERKDVQREYHNFFRKHEPELHPIMDLCRQLMNTGAGAE